MVEFRIRGNLRFLSHAETMKMFQRASVRAGLNVAHTQGFNPRPRMSLPLPRSVGVEADGELFAFVVEFEGDDAALCELESKIEASLSAELTEGCTISSVGTVRGGKTPQADCASYCLTIARQYRTDELENRIRDLLNAETVVVRRAGSKGSPAKELDVRRFVKSVETGDRGVSVECRITSAGSIRTEEILELLGLKPEWLEGPVKRTSVKWRQG